MGMWLSGIGISLVLIGAWFVAYEVVRKFEGDTHGAIAPTGGSVHSWKLASFKSWEKRRNKAMWIGLALITIGSLLQISGLFFQSRLC